MAHRQQVQGGLRYADVRLDADQDHAYGLMGFACVAWLGRRLLDELGREIRDHHAECRLVDYGAELGLVNERLELRDSGAESGCVLGSRVDWHVENLGGLDHLLGRGDDFRVLPYCCAELFLYVADK